MKFIDKSQPATLNALRETIEASCAAMTPDTDSRSSAASTLFSR
jgi:hypothetical protein